METTRSEAYSESIRTLFEVGTVAGMSDGQLLDRFLGGQGGGELAELAFAALVERHGPMVLRVCRARLGDDHDAQDAFQATFLILARKAGAIRRHESAASWLHGVALRVASCARRAADVRRARERAAAGRSSDSVPDSDREDVAPIVREEVGGLPEKYRTPLVLCLLDGLTHEEAAARLGWPVGTVKTRVRWARERLRTRLARRGLAPSIGAIGAALASSPAEAMSPALVRATARAALQVANGRAAIAGVASASVAKLVELGRRSLIMSWLKVVALVFASVGVLAAGASGLARQGSGPPQEQAKTAEPQTQAKTVAETPEVVEKVQEVAKSDPIAEEREIQDQIVAHLVDNESKMEAIQPQISVLKERIMQTYGKMLDLRESSRRHNRPGRKSDATFEAFEVKLKDDIKAHEAQMEDLRQEYDQAIRESKRLEWKIRRLTGDLARSLPGDSPAPVEQPDQPEQPEEPRTGDVEHRLADMERKLDLILKALEVRGGAKDQ